MARKSKLESVIKSRLGVDFSRAVSLPNGYTKLYHDNPLCDNDFSVVPKMYYISYWLGDVFYECHSSDMRSLAVIADRVRGLGSEVTSWCVCKEDSHLPSYIKTPF